MSIWTEQREYVIDKYDADVRAAGFSEAWDLLLAEEGTASHTLALGCLGAVAAYTVERRRASP